MAEGTGPQASILARGEGVALDLVTTDLTPRRKLYRALDRRGRLVDAASGAGCWTPRKLYLGFGRRALIETEECPFGGEAALLDFDVGVRVAVAEARRRVLARGCGPLDCGLPFAGLVVEGSLRPVMALAIFLWLDLVR